MQWWIYKIFLIDTKKWSITFSKKKDNINFIKKKVLEELETVKIRMINAHAMWLINYFIFLTCLFTQELFEGIDNSNTCVYL